MFAIVLSFVLGTPALAQTASPVDCEQEAADYEAIPPELRECGGDWLDIGSCYGGVVVQMFSKPASLQGYTCEEELEYVLEAHEDYMTTPREDQHIAESGPATVLLSLSRCASAGAYSCHDLQRLANQTEEFTWHIDTCDADQRPLFENFVAQVRETWFDQCVDDSFGGFQTVL